MSVLKQKWKLKNREEKISLREKLFLNRGMRSDEEIEKFLKIDESGGLLDPYLMKDMEKAVKRIKEAVKSQEKVIVFGDYDVDGITGAAILLHTFQQLGVNVSYRIPHRVEDGYGLNERFIDEFIEIGVGLVVTVDCGISCKNEVAKAQKNGIDVIITDHHTVPDELPEAVAIVHPLQSDCEYPYKGLVGAAVGFKVCQALIESEMPEEERAAMIESLLDLASLGTVADCGPLTGENRYIVKKGLKILKNTKWQGLRSLMETSGLGNAEAIDTMAVGFRIAPRINAAGRISSPLYALQLLLQEEGSPKAVLLAGKLEKINQTRQAMLEKALAEAEAGIDFENERIIIGWDEDWHAGIMGLIAGRLTNAYGLPAIIMQDKGERLVGSGRSNEHFNLVEALKVNEEFLDHYGGHHQAAGFDLKKENLEKFVKGMQDFAREKLADADLRPVLELECEIESRDVNWETLKLLEEMGPFGIGNEEPSFLLTEVEVKYAKRVGSDGSHLSMTVVFGGMELKAIAFRMGEFVEYVQKKGKIDLACRLQKNVWNDKESIQLVVVDLG